MFDLNALQNSISSGPSRGFCGEAKTLYFLGVDGSEQALLKSCRHTVRAVNLDASARKLIELAVNGVSSKVGDLARECELRYRAYPLKLAERGAFGGILKTGVIWRPMVCVEAAAVVAMVRAAESRAKVASITGCRVDCHHPTRRQPRQGQRIRKRVSVMDFWRDVRLGSDELRGWLAPRGWKVKEHKDLAH